MPRSAGTVWGESTFSVNERVVRILLLVTAAPPGRSTLIPCCCFKGSTKSEPGSILICHHKFKLFIVPCSYSSRLVVVLELLKLLMLITYVISSVRGWDGWDWLAIDWRLMATANTGHYRNFNEKPPKTNWEMKQQIHAHIKSSMIEWYEFASYHWTKKIEHKITVWPTSVTFVTLIATYLDAYILVVARCTYQQWHDKDDLEDWQ